MIARRLSVRAKLFLAIALAIFLPVAVLTALEIHFALAASTEGVREDIAVRGRFTARMLTARSELLRDALRELTGDPRLITAVKTGDRATLDGTMGRAAADFGSAAVAVASQEGRLLAGQGPEIAPGHAPPAWLDGPIQQALNGESGTATQHLPDGRLAVCAYAPIEDGVRLIAGAVACRPLDQAFLEALGMATGTPAILVRLDGRVEGGSLDPATVQHVLASGDTTTGFIRLAGRTYGLSTSVLVDATGTPVGYIGTLVPEFFLDSLALEVLGHAAVPLAIGLIVGLLLSLGLARNVVGPLEAIAQAARTIAAGGQAELPVVRGEDEVSTLGRSLATMLAALADRTERLAAANQRLAGYAAIVNASDDAIIGMAADGTIREWNPGAERLYGYTAAEAVGRPGDFLAADPRVLSDPLLTDRFRRVVEQGQVQRMEMRCRRKDGRLIDTAFTLSPILGEDGRVVGLVSVGRDVTEAKAIERMKDEFISVVSHELRTPLTSIRGALGLLASGLVGSLPERGQQMLAIAVKNTDRLVRLINDILDIERIESGKVVMQKQPCRLPDLFQQAVEAVQGSAERSGVRILTTPVEAWVEADPDRIVQVLTNLLGNAIKFSPENGTVWLSAAREGGTVVIRVRDQGRGIPSEKLEVIFERFQQVDASDAREKGGAGLGLAICRSIIQQHGGRIWAESTPGQGSTFLFTLKAVPGENRSGEEAPIPLTRSVLVCDDDPIAVEVTREMLARHGYHVITAASGAEAIERARQDRPDVILLDLLMPSPNGWDTMKRLKELAETREIPVVILSRMDGRALPFGELGVAGWVSKPLEERDLVHEVENAIATTPRAARVLVVEDDEDTARLIIRTFQADGVAVFRAATGAEAVRLSHAVVPDLLVLDLGLPDGDGSAVVESLRRDGRLAHVPVVVYSARDVDEPEREHLRLGYTEFQTKGRVSPEQFERHVLRLLDQIVPNRRAPSADPVGVA
ncbi:MAG: response regulator [Chloroflexi bacterium]|nr:response regulator [Chloroflexota bacterium]